MVISVMIMRVTISIIKYGDEYNTEINKKPEIDLDYLLALAELNQEFPDMQ